MAILKGPQNFLRQTFVNIKALIMDHNPGPDLVKFAQS